MRIVLKVRVSPRVVKVGIQEPSEVEQYMKAHL
jgi:hypothetical protein